jgi:hypothetical protein
VFSLLTAVKRKENLDLAAEGATGDGRAFAARRPLPQAATSSVTITVPFAAMNASHWPIFGSLHHTLLLAVPGAVAAT